jgi:hypothetical protein
VNDDGTISGTELLGWLQSGALHRAIAKDMLPEQQEKAAQALVELAQFAYFAAQRVEA